MLISKAQIKLVRSLQQKKFRDELGLFVAEGEKCVEELRKAFELVSLYREGDNANRVAIEQMSGLRAPQGVVGVFRKRSQESGFRNQDSDLVLALDGIQDPGNLGTIIRTCDWFGVHDIFCSQDTADCYNPKVVQATMGALARVHVDLPEWLEGIRKQEPGLRIYGTLLDGRNMYEVLEPSAISSQCSVIVMGNEGNGISPTVRQLVTVPVRIPSYPPDAETSESLNVSIATAIILAAFRRYQS